MRTIQIMPWFLYRSGPCPYVIHVVLSQFLYVIFVFLSLYIDIHAPLRINNLKVM